MKSWFCVVSRPNQECRAAIELANQSFHVYLPVIDAKPMFPRYLFVEFDREKDPWGSIKSTRGCVDLLRNGFLPAMVPRHAMDAIMAYQPQQEAPAGPNIFTEGQVVRVIEGPLQGLQGLFQRDAKGRVSCLIEIMGRRVELPKESIRAA